jgi:hypothetical protein
MTSSPEPLSTPPARRPRRRRAAALTTASVVSFSLTLLAGAIAVLTGIVPLHPLSLGDRVNIGELLFLMQIVELVLGVIVEASRMALTRPELPEPRRQQAVRWTPGSREG